MSSQKQKNGNDPGSDAVVKLVAASNVEPVFSKRQPAWHIVVLGITTLMMYPVVYWFYKNWRNLRDEAQRLTDYSKAPGLALFANINPGLRTLGLLVPLLNVYLYLTYILGITQIVPDEKSYPRRHPLVAAGALTGLVLAFLALALLPVPWHLLYLLSSLPFAIVQHWLNQYWKSVEEPDMLVRHGFNIGEMLSIIAGASLLGLVIAGWMLGLDHVPPPSAE